MNKEKLYKLAQDSYNLSCLIKTFIESELCCEEMQILNTSVNILHKKIDLIYAEMINTTS